jgi:hypothetical protein
MPQSNNHQKTFFMKPSYTNCKKNISKFALLTTMMFFMAVSKTKAQDVDLQAVAINPSAVSISVGQTAFIQVSMRNNGPAAIPMGEATAQVTFSSVYLDFGPPALPVNFSNPGCTNWTYLGNVPGAGTNNLFFRNDAGVLAPATTCNFQFDVRGKAGVAGANNVITLASSLSPTASVNDVNGTNQSASAELTVTGTPDLTASQLFTTTQVAAGGVIDEVVAIRNVGASPTSAPTVFDVTVYTALSGLTVTSNPNPTVTIGFTPYTLDNVNWAFNPATGVFTSNAGVFVQPGVAGVRYLGVRITRGTNPNQGSNGTVNQTVTITNGTGGGETPTNNNTINNSLQKN